jgi:flagellin-specific chaperone FliS
MTSSKDRIDAIRKRAEARKGTEVRAFHTNRLDSATPEQLAEMLMEEIAVEAEESTK